MPKRAKSRKSVRKRAASPVLRARQAPRGLPFPKGHTIGLATRFAPGQSGNPGGRPKSKKLSDAYRAIAESDLDDPVPVRTNAEAIARKIFLMAKRGNLSAAREIADRCEGRPMMRIENDGQNNLAVLIASMNEVSEKLGPPEGHPRSRPPLLEAGDDEIVGQTP